MNKIHRASTQPVKQIVTLGVLSDCKSQVAETHRAPETLRDIWKVRSLGRDFSKTKQCSTSHPIESPGLPLLFPIHVYLKVRRSSSPRKPPRHHSHGTWENPSLKRGACRQVLLFSTW